VFNKGHTIKTWESGHIDVCIINLSTGWRQVVSFMPQPMQKAHSTYWIRGWMGPRAREKVVERKKPFAPAAAKNPTPVTLA
jgi:hypothetical protein